MDEAKKTFPMGRHRCLQTLNFAQLGLAIATSFWADGAGI
jgi:hypothetical protein